MNTEPPLGDDFQRLLVGMKRSVLDRADDVRPRPVRHRHVWPVVGLVALLAVGSVSGAYAVGLVPHDLFLAPTAAPSPTVSEPSSPSTPAAETPPASSTAAQSATPMSTAKPFSIDDPGTWTTSFSEVGPIALGAPYAGEIDDLTSAYTRDNESCPNPNVSFWHRTGSVELVVENTDGVVSGVSIGLVSPTDPSHRTTAPTTPEGAGIGSTLAQLKTLYPDIENTGNYGGSGADGGFEYWSIHSADGYITFVLGADNSHVGQVWVAATPQPPSEFCG